MIKEALNLIVLTTYTVFYSDRSNLPPERQAPVEVEQKTEMNTEQQEREQAEKEDAISEVSKLCMASCLHVSGSKLKKYFGELPVP